MSADETPEVVVEAITRGHVLAYVDGVRVRIRTRATLPPLWLCDEHPGDGRTGCEHIAALADTPAPVGTETPTSRRTRRDDR